MVLYYIIYLRQWRENFLLVEEYNSPALPRGWIFKCVGLTQSYILIRGCNFDMFNEIMQQVLLKKKALG